MRELSVAELMSIYYDRRCPFCSAAFDSFIPGPRGAMGRNMECASCRAIVNVLAPDYWERWPDVRIGQLIRAPQLLQ